MQVRSIMPIGNYPTNKQLNSPVNMKGSSSTERMMQFSREKSKPSRLFFDFYSKIANANKHTLVQFNRQGKEVDVLKSNGTTLDKTESIKLDDDKTMRTVIKSQVDKKAPDELKGIFIQGSTTDSQDARTAFVKNSDGATYTKITMASYKFPDSAQDEKEKNNAMVQALDTSLDNYILINSAVVTSSDK